MDLQLKGKRALVTGSSAGIGEAIVRRLAAEGASVVVHGRDRKRTENVAAEISGSAGKARGGSAHTAAVAIGDLGSDAGADAVREQALKALDGVDVLVCNAGIYDERPWSETTAADWLDTYNQNVASVVRMVRAFVPAMREARWGRVVVISSGAGWQPIATMPDYCSSKAAMLALTVSLAKDLAGTGVTVNTVSPGVIVTDHVRTHFTSLARKNGWPTDWPSIEKTVLTTALPNSSGRLGRPEDVADLVAFVASPLAGYVNGANLRVDGGSTLSIN
jgi:NAD(P)-dependent dehydrogenase (short-subunit alcohol dehydrogenase family)